MWDLGWFFLYRRTISTTLSWGFNPFQRWSVLHRPSFLVTAMVPSSMIYLGKYGDFPKLFWITRGYSLSSNPAANGWNLRWQHPRVSRKVCFTQSHSCKVLHFHTRTCRKILEILPNFLHWSFLGQWKFPASHASPRCIQPLPIHSQFFSASRHCLGLTTAARPVESRGLKSWGILDQNQV